mmetsp:Transcript_5812/g.10090  ORF Transcript_5812/g.10090 Transcript_5812/m.10090 type:complete len:202 (-) Transcript_5812:183-788(-)
MMRTSSTVPACPKNSKTSRSPPLVDKLYAKTVRVSRSSSSSSRLRSSASLSSLRSCLSASRSSSVGRRRGERDLRGFDRERLLSRSLSLFLSLSFLRSLDRERERCLLDFLSLSLSLSLRSFSFSPLLPARSLSRSLSPRSLSRSLPDSLDDFSFFLSSAFAGGSAPAGFPSNCSSRYASGSKASAIATAESNSVCVYFSY